MPSAKRINWSKIYPDIPQLDLLAVQKESWAEFLKKDLIDTVHSVSPISDYTGNNWVLELGDVSFDKVNVTPAL